MTATASGSLRVQVPIDVFDKALRLSDISILANWIEEVADAGRLPAAFRHILRQKADPRDVIAVFEEHKKLFWKGRGRAPQLLEGKRRLIRKRLERFSVDELLTAMRVVASDPWWCGQNDRGKTFTDITTIFKNDETVERFLMGETGNVRTLQEKRQESVLKVTELADSIRSGVMDPLDGKQKLSTLCAAHERDFGEVFSWETNTFAKR